MAKRSLQASDEGIRKAKQAFKRKGWTQEYLAAEVGLETRQPIWKFFTGKPIDRQVFSEICFILELDPQEIAQPSEDYTVNNTTSLEIVSDNTLDIHALVQKVRCAYYEKIQNQCSTLRLLDIARTVRLEDLYIDVNILEEITSQKFLEIADLQSFATNEFERFGLGNLLQERVAGLEAVVKYSKLMVLGKPGTGKTTFLQSIAIRCNHGNFQADCVPIFISLKNFAEDSKDDSQLSLLNYLEENFINCGISQTEILTIFSHGKAVILLDGLDEVPDVNTDTVIKGIRNFTEKYYKNTIIIACRIAANQYKFQGFTEVEIADFNKSQIAAFVEKWFLAVGQSSRPPAKKSLGEDIAAKFMQKLELPENRQIRELVATPILLNLTCLMFQCVGDFPANLSELYKQGLDLLLLRWDEARGIKRDEVYRNLSLLHKIKLLSYVAAIAFTQGDYFISENKIQQLIADYLRHLPDPPSDPDALLLDSSAVLKSIETQHGLLVERARGIYSFSHLTFQQYFMAREIVANANPQTLQELVSHVHEKRWREVFLLAVGMLDFADDLLQLMQQQIVTVATSEPKLQDFISWVGQKSATVHAPYRPAAVHAFYFTLALPPEHPLARSQSLAISLDCQLAGNLALGLALDLALTHTLAVSLAMTGDIFFQRLSALSLALDLEHLLEDNPFLRQSLQDLKNQLPSSQQSRDALSAWWQANGQAWTEQLRTLMISTRQIGFDWQFNENEWHLLQQYWDANKLLLDCLNSAGNVTPQMQDSIEEGLFLINSQ